VSQVGIEPTTISL